MIRINENKHISSEGKVLQHKESGERRWYVNGPIEGWDEVDATEEEKSARAEYISPEGKTGRKQQPNGKTATKEDLKAKAAKAAAFLKATD